MVQKLKITPEDEKELGRYIVYKDDFPVFIGNVQDVMEFTGYSRATVYSSVLRTKNGHRRSDNYMIYAIDSEDEIKEMNTKPKGKKYIVYQRDENGNYQQVAIGTIKEIANELKMNEHTLKSHYGRTKQGKAIKTRVYKVDELI